MRTKTIARRRRAVLAGTLAGLLYAITFLRHGRIGDAVVAHATTNALLAALVLLLVVHF